MDYLMLILTVIGTTATAISAVIAVKAKNEAKDILNVNYSRSSLMEPRC